MPDFAAIEYKQLYVGNIAFKRNGTVSRAQYQRSSRDVTHKMACFRIDADESRATVFLDYAMDYCAPQKLYICSECRTPRDIIRNTGYKIVRDKDSADAIVVPDPGILKPAVYYANVVVFNKTTGSLYVFTCSRDWQPLNDKEFLIQDGDFDKIKALFHSDVDQNEYDFFFDDIQQRFPVEFLPVIEEYKELLTGTRNYKMKYMSEGELHLICPTDINPETMCVWSKSADYDMLANTIAVSNWREYPITILMFVACFKKDIRYYGGPKFRLLLDSIGYDSYKNVDGMLSGRLIEPKDWNMFQDFMMMINGVSEEGGYPQDSKSAPNINAGEYVRSRYAIKPLRIEAPTTWENIKTMLKR